MRRFLYKLTLRCMSDERLGWEGVRVACAGSPQWVRDALAAEWKRR